MEKKFYWLVVMIIVIVFMTSSFIYAVDLDRSSGKQCV